MMTTHLHRQITFAARDGSKQKGSDESLVTDTSTTNRMSDDSSSSGSDNMGTANASTDAKPARTPSVVKPPPFVSVTTPAEGVESNEQSWGERFSNFKMSAVDSIKRKAQYVYVVFTLYILPSCAALIPSSTVVASLYFTGLAAVTFVNLWMLTECAMSIVYTRRQRALHRSKPTITGERRLSAIVAAYLPNELTVLVDTVKAISAQIHCLPDTTTLDIVLAHNGGKAEQRIALLEDLRKLEEDFPLRVTLHELNVTSSTSKAQNVNAGLGFLQQLSTDRCHDFTHVAMYDADHQPIPQAYLYALETLQDQEADMVMGRCCVQDGYKFIAIEFDILYAVAHAGGRMVRGFGFFGGSNGYWDFKTLCETGMDETMLTEDVDSSFRAQAAGHRMTYDPTIVSYEESPPSINALFKQRLRWSQGWAEVTWRQLYLFLRPAPGLTLWSRFCIFLLLPFREMYLYIASFIVPIAVVQFLATGCGIACLDMRLLVVTAFCLLLPVIMTTVAAFITTDSVEGTKYSMQSLTWKDYVRYIFISYLYDFWKMHINVMGHVRNWLGFTKWVVTKRKTTKNDAMPIFTPGINVLERPESLVENSPYATSPRRFFAQCWNSNHMMSDESTMDSSSRTTSSRSAISRNDILSQILSKTTQHTGKPANSISFEEREAMSDDDSVSSWDC